MGITLQHATLLAIEATYRRLPDTVHLIGRQTVYLDASKLAQLARRFGFSQNDRQVEVDTQTGGARQDRLPYVTDSFFFETIGAKKIVSVDISPYEGANIILDLNRPISDDYEGIADFIFGGSVCDNVFDPAMYLRNVCRMLRPGGRYVSQEIASNEYHPYVVLPPAWHFDYFVINRFADVQLLVFDIKKFWNVYGLDVEPDYQFLPNFTAPHDHTLGVFIVAEKGAHSTWHRSPTQEQFRNSSEWNEFRESLRSIRATRRPFPRFASPRLESEIESHPPKWLPYYEYLGRIGVDFEYERPTSLQPRVSALVSKWKAEGKLKIAIWGAGPITTQLFTSTNLLSAVDIDFLVDSNPALWGTEIHGRPIFSPSELSNRHPEVVLISSRAHQSAILSALNALAQGQIEAEILFEQ